MIIGFDGSRAFSKDRTGTENYSYQLLKALAKIDKKNNYLVFLRKEAPREKFPRNFYFKTIDWLRLWTQAGLAKQTFQDKLDVLFIPAHTSPLIRRPGLKTVITVHDLGSEYLPRMHQLKQRLYLKWITHYQLKNATKLIAVSKATKQDLINTGIDAKKIEVIYEGYDKNMFRVHSSEFRDDTLIDSLKHYELQTNNYFLFVGTVQPRKNLERLIKAVASLNQKLVIVGAKGWMSDEIYKLGAQNKVKFLGRVPDQALPELYKGAKALLFPSLFEGFGLPLIEAQACGCPVLTSNTSSMPEVAGKGAIYVNPNKVEDIIKGIIKMNNQDTRNKLIRLGYENIKRFSWEKCAEETLKVLEKV